MTHSYESHVSPLSPLYSAGRNISKVSALGILFYMGNFAYALTFENVLPVPDRPRMPLRKPLDCCHWILKMANCMYQMLNMVSDWFWIYWILYPIFEHSFANISGQLPLNQILQYSIHSESNFRNIHHLEHTIYIIQYTFKHMFPMLNMVEDRFLIYRIVYTNTWTYCGEYFLAAASAYWILRILHFRWWIVCVDAQEIRMRTWRSRRRKLNRGQMSHMLSEYTSYSESNMEK